MFAIQTRTLTQGTRVLRGKEIGMRSTTHICIHSDSKFAYSIVREADNLHFVYAYANSSDDVNSLKFQWILLKFHLAFLFSYDWFTD